MSPYMIVYVVGVLVLLALYDFSGMLGVGELGETPARKALFVALTWPISLWVCIVWLARKLSKEDSGERA